jgi:hypothetical protein
MKKPMTLEQHIENANDLAMAAHYLKRVFYRCKNHNNKTSKLMEAVAIISPEPIKSRWHYMLDLLDDQYHAIIDDDTFCRMGHIYYSLDERYRNLRDEGGEQ